MILVNKRRIIQKRYLIAAVAFLFLCILTFFFQWIFTPLISKYGGPDFNTTNGGTPALFRWHLICSGFQLDKWMSTLVNFTFPLLPLMPIIFAYNFLKEKSGYYINAYTRIRNYKGFMWKGVSVHALLSGIYFYATYLVFLAMGMVLSKTIFYDSTVYGINNRRSLFAAWTIYPNYYTKGFLGDVFGRYFFNYHPITFYVIFGFVATFIFGIVYALFAISVSFITDKNYLSVLIPYAYFVFASILFSMLVNKLLILAPVSTFGGLAFTGEPTYFSIVPMIAPLAFSVTVLLVKINRGDRLGF